MFGKLLVAHRLDRLDREPADARQVVVDVVLRHAELLEVAANRLAGDAGVAQRRDGRAGRALGELLAVLAEDQAVVDELGRRRAERLEQAAVQLLVRAMVEAAHDVRDPEVDVVDDAREVVGRGAVLAEERRAPELTSYLARSPTTAAVSQIGLRCCSDDGPSFSTDDADPLEVWRESLSTAPLHLTRERSVSI